MTKVRNQALLTALGKQVKRLRTDRGLTLQDLAAKCEVDYRQVIRIEKGESNSSISMVFRLANGLEVTICELMDFEL